MAGLTVDCFLHLNRDFEAKTQILKSPQYENQKNSIEKTLNFLQQLAQSRDVRLLLAVERMILEYALKYDTNSPEERHSVKIAIEQLDSCTKCLSSLSQNPAGYRENVYPTYSDKTKEAGLPLDAARQFFKSHATRLTNNLVSKASDIEKELLRQRKSNVAVMRDCYVELQRKALGNTQPK